MAAAVTVAEDAVTVNAVLYVYQGYDASELRVSREDLANLSLYDPAEVAGNLSFTVPVVAV